MIKRSGDVVCGLHRACGDEECEFFGWALIPRSTVYQWLGVKTTGTISHWFGLKTTGTVCRWFGLKTTRMVSPGLAWKLVVMVTPSLASKQVVTGFPVWASKPAATVWWFGPQNQCDGFLVWASKPSGLRFVGCAIKLMGGWRQCWARVEI
jgi:hypothetical protein